MSLRAWREHPECAAMTWTSKNPDFAALVRESFAKQKAMATRPLSCPLRLIRVDFSLPRSS